MFFEVNGITRRADRTLDEVKAKVVADWTAAEAQRLIGARGAELEKRLKDGATLDALATELKLEKQTKRGLKRQADDGDFGSSGVQAVFAVAEGGTGTVRAPTGGGRILFKVTEVFEPAASDAGAIAGRRQDDLRPRPADDLLDQLVARLQSQIDVRIDRAAVERAHTL